MQADAQQTSQSEMLQPLGATGLILIKGAQTKPSRQSSAPVLVYGQISHFRHENREALTGWLQRVFSPNPKRTGGGRDISRPLSVWVVKQRSLKVDPPQNAAEEEDPLNGSFAETSQLSRTTSKRTILEFLNGSNVS